MLLKKIIKKIIRGKFYDSKSYIKYLRNKGIKIGNNCRIFNPKMTMIDTQYPYMLEIGNNVYITSGVTILNHDYSWVVLSGIKGNILGGVGKVEIGDNVFIGANSIILKNTKIGNNVIIGAGSVVTGVVESNYVYAGNPAKKIMSIEEFYNKKTKRLLNDSKEIYKMYFEKYKNIPSRKEFYEYCFLFINSIKDLTSEERALIERTGYSELIFNEIETQNAKFKNYEEFIDYISSNE